MLVRWYDDHADFWWRVNGGEDQGGWRTVLSAAGNYRHIEPADWRHPAFVCSHAGTPYLVHRCQGKFWGHDLPPTNYDLPREREFLATIRRLYPGVKHVASETFQQSKDRVRAERRAFAHH